MNCGATHREPRRVDRVAEVVERAVGHECDERLLAVGEAHDADQRLGHVDVRALVLPADVIDGAEDALVHDVVERARDVLRAAPPDARKRRRPAPKQRAPPEPRGIGVLVRGVCVCGSHIAPHRTHATRTMRQTLRYDRAVRATPPHASRRGVDSASHSFRADRWRSVHHRCAPRRKGSCGCSCRRREG